MSYFAQAHRHAEAINQRILKDPVLSKRFVSGTYNYLQCFQVRLFGMCRAMAQDPDEAIKTLLLQRHTSVWSYKTVVLAMIALAVSMLAWLRMVIRRDRVMVFGVDNVSSRFKRDFRAEGIHAVLHDCQMGYTDALHVVLGKQFLRTLWKRKQLGFYVQAFVILSSLWCHRSKSTTAQVSEERLRSLLPDRLFQELVIERMETAIPVFDRTVGILSWLLRATALTHLFTVDEPRGANELTAACQQQGIRVCAFQHGHYTKYHYGWLDCCNTIGQIICPDTLFVWSTYWKQELLRIGTYFDEPQLVVGGKYRKEVAQARAMFPAVSVEGGVKDIPIQVLVPYEIDAIKAEVIPYMRALAAHPEVTLLFKPRPDIPTAQQLSEYELEESGLVRVIDTVEPHLAAIDVVVGTYSTFLYDMLEHNIPVVYLTTSLDYGEGLVINGLATKATHETLYEALTTACARTAAERRRDAERVLDTSVSFEETLARVLAV